MAAVRDIQGFYSEALAEHARGNSQEVQRAVHSHYEKVQAEYGQRVNEIRSSLDALYQQNLHRAAHECRLELVQAEGTVTTRYNAARGRA